jgi:hypothetical protein
MTIDWSRPIVTNAGKPGRVIDGPHGKPSAWKVEANWANATWANATKIWCYADGRPNIDLGGEYVRQAAPAEILAHPDVWPEWQDWARERQRSAEVAEVVKRVMNTPQPITHAAILAAVQTLPEHAGPAEAAEHIARAIGVEVPVKAAPWEVAFDAWFASADYSAGQRPTWQAAVEWCVGQADYELSTSDFVNVRRRIMGEQP